MERSSTEGRMPPAPFPHGEHVCRRRRPAGAQSRLRGDAALRPERPREATRDLGENETVGLEEIEEGIVPAEDRFCDETAAGKAEDVAVTRVAASDPHTVLTRNAPDDREEVEHEPEDACPAVVDAELPSDERADESLEGALDGLRRHLLVRELVLQRDVAEATRDDAAVRRLMPVVEPMPPVVRNLEVALADRLGGDHLAAGRHDEAFERAE